MQVHAFSENFMSDWNFGKCTGTEFEKHFELLHFSLSFCEKWCFNK